MAPPQPTIITTTSTATTPKLILKKDENNNLVYAKDMSLISSTISTVTSANSAIVDYISLSASSSTSSLSGNDNANINRARKVRSSLRNGNEFENSVPVSSVTIHNDMNKSMIARVMSNGGNTILDNELPHRASVYSRSNSYSNNYGSNERYKNGTVSIKSDSCSVNGSVNINPNEYDHETEYLSSSSYLYGANGKIPVTGVISEKDGGSLYCSTSVPVIDYSNEDYVITRL